MYIMNHKAWYKKNCFLKKDTDGGLSWKGIKVEVRAKKKNLKKVKIQGKWWLYRNGRKGNLGATKRVNLMTNQCDVKNRIERKCFWDNFLEHGQILQDFHSLISGPRFCARIGQ